MSVTFRIVFRISFFFELFKPFFSEVSKRGWRTEGVGARKSLPHHKFRPFFCPLFPVPPYEVGGHNSGVHFRLHFGHCWSPTPYRQPLFETSDIRTNFFCLFGGQLGDKFGESLGGSQVPPSFWEFPGLPRKFPGLPRKFFGDFPGSSLTVELNSNSEVPRKFPKLPRKFPKLPRKFPDFPGGQPLSLGSLTPGLS